MQRATPSDVNGASPGTSDAFAPGQAAPSGSSTRDPRDRPPGEDPWRGLRDELGRSWNAWRRSWIAERRLWQLRIFDLSLRVGLWICALLCASAVSLVAAYLIVSSLRLGLERWSDGAWWSDLVLGVFLLAAVAFVLARARRGVHRRALARVQLALSLPPSDPKAAQEIHEKDPTLRARREESLP